MDLKVGQHTGAVDNTAASQLQVLATILSTINN